jgi:hypothetical protein
MDKAPKSEGRHEGEGSRASAGGLDVRPDRDGAGRLQEFDLAVGEGPAEADTSHTRGASAISKRGWEVTLRKREEERQRVKARSAQEIDHLSDRELFLIGVGLYWAEGSKSKPYRRHEAVTFINSDPDMIRVYLAWLDLLGVAGDRRRFSVMIHESADVESAERYWADLVGRDVTEFGKTTSKRRNPKTVRKNVGSDYRGCLVVRVLQGADLYRRIEGWWSGVAAQCRPADGLRRSGMV